MKILKISGKNLASLAAGFCVDFEQEPLASSGLFAISGPTGAGKSTLLDALCLALYGATPRLQKSTRAALVPDVGAETVSAQDPRTLLRRGAAEGHAEVDFVGNDGMRYRARWSVRRARRKAAGGLQNSDMSLHRLPELIALGGTKTEAAQEIALRIGLTFEQFTRAVLLAQNEFSAFLKTDENERGELLETLTGSAIYSAISKRAFERYKAEQAALQQLAARLADQAPLPPDERTALDASSIAADGALLAIDQRKTLIEQHLRWQQEAAQLRQNATNAEQALAAAHAAVEAAQPRRRRLATLDAAEPARPLLAESARLDAEHAMLRDALASAENDLQRALERQAQATLALSGASQKLQTAEHEQRSAAPLLDQAKALDAAIAALAPNHRQALAGRDGAAAETSAAAESLRAASVALTEVREAHAQAEAWLAGHRGRETMAAQWPRWDKLLAQAGQAAANARTLEAQLAQAVRATADAVEQEAAASGAAAESALGLQAAEEARQQSIAALAAFDGAQLSETRQVLEQRRDALAGAERTWSDLTAARARAAQVAAQATQAANEGAAAQAQLDSAAAAASALASAAAQAERSLKAAQLACADSVEDLRANLVDDAPCPVCGSAAHPYQHQNAQLHALLANLQAELDACRAQAADNLSRQATQRAMAAAGAAQAATLAREHDALAESGARLEAEWNAYPLAADVPDEALRGAWFATELATLKARARQLDAQEKAARSAAQARDLAQHTCDEAGRRHAALRDAAATARAALASAQAAQSALADKHAQSGTSLANLLDELDGAFDGEWRSHWQAAPDLFRIARAGEALQWTEQSTAQATRSAALVKLDAEHSGARTRLEHARKIEASVQADFAWVDADIAARRRERGALWEGRTVQEVERALAGAIDTARQALALQQAASEQARLAETKAREALAHNSRRLEEVGAAALAARNALAAWLAGFAVRHPMLDCPADGAGLASMLASDAGAKAAERAALDALDAAAAAASTVLAERRARCEHHRQSAPAENMDDADKLAADLSDLAPQRKRAHDDATALRLQLAQDDVRRTNAQATMAGIERQQLVERRWGKLSELIGSSDGKKFRNYAQQFTLDVLLGYANAHLGQLARRYRLERVASAGGPSLGLMVRDQDMGGEVRGVNSLSGGESFLVSLALALGLASLSSNRVRVESLFIDEGFGSLDSDTLRVAMDTLDGLQSMGRKVGVISHVQEMTERIATRIIVQPSGGGSSSVTVQ